MSKGTIAEGWLQTHVPKEVLIKFLETCQEKDITPYALLRICICDYLGVEMPERSRKYQSITETLKELKKK